jgi:3-phenylpropionate/trans-cinnamate dioxygenase ferredoxin subunit
MRIRVVRVEEVAPGATKLVCVEGTPVVLVNDDGRVYALYGLCSHQHQPLAGGKVWKGVLDCPWHHFQWDLKTGENLYPRRVYPLNAMPHLRDQVRTLPTYEVTIVDGFVDVEMPEAGAKGREGESSRPDQ